MTVAFNAFTGNFDLTGITSVPDPLTVNNLTVNTLLTAAHIHGNIAGSLYIHVKNLDTAPLEKGTPFYITGTVGASDRVEIKRADADGSGTGPAVGLVESTLAVNGEGNGIIIGEIYNYDTSTPGWSTNDTLYVSTSGTLTNIRPSTGYRQSVGHVGRIQSSTGTIVVNIGKKEPVAGSTTQIQFNDDGGFGASSDLTFNKTTKLLRTTGDINLDDGSTYTTTLQSITPTANRTISFPDATGTVGLVAGSTGNLIWNNAGAYAGITGSTADTSGNITLAGRLALSVAAAASAPPLSVTGTWFSGGTATTTKPQFLVEPTGTTSTAWSTSGTGLGVNAASGFAGNLLDLQVNGTSQGNVTSAGNLNLAGNISLANTVVQGITVNATRTNSSSNSILDFQINSSPLLRLTNAGGAKIVALATIQGNNGFNTVGNLNLAGATPTGNVLTNGGTVFIDGGVGILGGTTGNIVIGQTAGNLQITDARNVVLGTTTGTKIGTATTQKLGFYNATPVVQPTAVANITTTATAGTLPTADGTVTIADAATPTVTELLEYCVELEAKLEAALGRLRDLGLIAT